MDRDRLLERLECDLVGPLEIDETLQDARPSDVYLTGILWPNRARIGEEDSERLDSAGAAGGSGEDDTQGSGEEVPINGTQRPCVAGVSFALEGKPESLTVSLRLMFALYQPETVDETGSSSNEIEQVGEATGSSTGSISTGEQTRKPRRVLVWKRRPFDFRVAEIPVPDKASTRITVTADGLPSGVSIHMRTTTAANGAVLVTCTAINAMVPEEDSRNAVESVTMFQVQLVVEPGSHCHLIEKPDFSRDGDEEESSAQLLYRNARTYAAGHTCSATWEPTSGVEKPTSVSTTWMPRAVVPRVHAGGHAEFNALRADPDLRPLDARWLTNATDAQLRKGLGLLVQCYAAWISKVQSQAENLPTRHREAADRNVATCTRVKSRIERGITAICETDSLRDSFRLANLAMQMQHEWNPERNPASALQWRPFQLAFILMTAPSVCDAADAERDVMDLLWFPTGGGKTEAYLALIAMLAFYRRISGRDPEDRSGVAAIMRYTLRLLTTQQFVRATALLMACEQIRRAPPTGIVKSTKLGNRPISIGLWVGGEATPNRYENAVRALGGDLKEASPRQLLECPCCHGKLNWQANEPKKSIEVYCAGSICGLGMGGVVPLPIWTVDDDIYRECPTLIIGTIDKFAQVPRRKEVKRLFAVRTSGAPDLVIQDELHLISGPLGTIAAGYEVALDWLIAQGARRAKIIGSTATIRRAKDQIRALFNREASQFPPPGIDHQDSGFAVLDFSAEVSRLYVGVTTAGRSAKFTLQAVAGCLLQAAWGVIPDDARRDPYATLVAYFNSLRELGGALVLMQDDVNDAISLYTSRHPAESRRPIRNIEELTSRRTQEEVRDMLGKLAARFGSPGCVDAVLATNMVSVGVDVPRLGLMVVNGQPKSRSEYIQATSRVGRDRAPGLVVAILNNAKPRDRSHFETFPMWHASLYRDVEATSVTPFASRARDRVMHAAFTTMIRHGVDGMLDAPRFSDRSIADEVVEEVVKRAEAIDPQELRVRRELELRLDDWEARQPGAYWNDRTPKKSLLQSAERAAALKALGRSIGDAWPTMNNMRSVEPGVRFRMTERLAQREEDDGQP